MSAFHKHQLSLCQHRIGREMLILRAKCILGLNMRSPEIMTQPFILKHKSRIPRLCCCKEECIAFIFSVFFRGGFFFFSCGDLLWLQWIFWGLERRTLHCIQFNSINAYWWDSSITIRNGYDNPFSCTFDSNESTWMSKHLLNTDRHNSHLHNTLLFLLSFFRICIRIKQMIFIHLT